VHPAKGALLLVVTVGACAYGQGVQPGASGPSPVRTTSRTQTEAQQSAIGEYVPDLRDHPLAASEKAGSSQLSGTVVDPSGAVLAGAAVQVRSAN